MWFTRISLHNPVLATMMMAALVVLGLFSMQRLKVDQFPNIDFPTVVVITDYPGAAPEIVESEVSKKLEEAVNSIAGISSLTSRSYEGQSVVVINFDLTMDGRKAADDVREKVASVKPLLRTEVKEPRVLRFDPSAKAIWSVAVLPDEKGPPLSAVELTNWAEQVFKKRLENVPGVGSASVVGGTKREINIYLNPQAMDALGVTADGDALSGTVERIVDADAADDQTCLAGTEHPQTEHQNRKRARPGAPSRSRPPPSDRYRAGGMQERQSRGHRAHRGAMWP